MAKYLISASYTAEGAKGVLKEGGTKRRQAAEQAIKSAGGKLEAFYFAFGDNDAFVIVDAPDHASVAAMSLAINASGAVRTKTVVLLTPEEIDQATKKGTTYRAPGH
ncbi:MAG: GYD domain protein [Acidobacteria bacterium]|nr:MAG: GYD domain protein [Acidobacteriota bacterium]